MKTAPALALFLCLTASSQAVVTYTFREDYNAVVASYSGQLNTAGLSFQGGLSYSSRYADILGAVVPGQQIIDIENAQPLPVGQHPSHLGTSFRFSADDITFELNMDFSERRYYAPNSTGDTFGFYIFERAGSFTTWMNLPWQYVSGSPISGQMRFEGESLASMGLEASESFTVFLPGGESIVGRVIPEPGTALLVLSAAGMTSAAGRRRRATGVRAPAEYFSESR